MLGKIAGHTGDRSIPVVPNPQTEGDVYEDKLPRIRGERSGAVRGADKLPRMREKRPLKDPPRSNISQESSPGGDEEGIQDELRPDPREPRKEDEPVLEDPASSDVGDLSRLPRRRILAEEDEEDPSRLPRLKR